MTVNRLDDETPAGSSENDEPLPEFILRNICFRFKMLFLNIYFPFVSSVAIGTWSETSVALPVPLRWSEV